MGQFKVRGTHEAIYVPHFVGIPTWKGKKKRKKKTYTESFSFLQVDNKIRHRKERARTNLAEGSCLQKV